MRKFKWPENIKFDDTMEDMEAARNAWSKAQEIQPYGLTVGEFLLFIELYAEEVDRRRRIENQTLIVQSA